MLAAYRCWRRSPGPCTPAGTLFSRPVPWPAAAQSIGGKSDYPAPSRLPSDTAGGLSQYQSGQPCQGRGIDAAASQEVLFHRLGCKIEKTEKIILRRQGFQVVKKQRRRHLPHIFRSYLKGAGQEFINLLLATTLSSSIKQVPQEIKAIPPHIGHVFRILRPLSDLLLYANSLQAPASGKNIGSFKFSHGSPPKRADRCNTAAVLNLGSCGFHAAVQRADFRQPLQHLEFQLRPAAGLIQPPLNCAGVLIGVDLPIFALYHERAATTGQAYALGVSLGSPNIELAYPKQNFSVSGLDSIRQIDRPRFRPVSFRKLAVIVQAFILDFRNDVVLFGKRPVRIAAAESLREFDGHGLATFGFTDPFDVFYIGRQHFTSAGIGSCCHRLFLLVFVVLHSKVQLNMLDCFVIIRYRVPAFPKEGREDRFLRQVRRIE
nr:MAG TPA: hypothetical protein [Caudoviricetes sp.]